MSKSAVDLTQGPVPRHVLRMLGPFWLAILALMSASVVDTIYLGRLSTDALAAVGFCYPIIFFGNSISIGLGAGTLSAISRAIGRKDYAQARTSGASSIILVVLLLSGYCALGYMFMSAILDSMGIEEDIKILAQSYLKFAFPAVIVSGIAMMSNNSLRAGGEALLPSTIMISAAILNIIIDPLLIFGIGPFPRLEVEGAAIATLISNSFGAVYALFLVFFYRKNISFIGLGIKGLRKAWGIIGRVGFPAIGTNIIAPLAGYASIAIIGNLLGKNEVAAFTLVSRVGMLALTLLYALSACIGAITGQNGGAGLTDRVRETFGFCFKICVFWALFLAVTLAVLAPYIPMIFSKDEVVIALAMPYFYIVPITMGFYGFVFVSAAGLNALGRPQYGLVFTVIRSVIMITPFIWLGVFYYGLTGAYIGTAIANVLSGSIAIYYTLRKAPMDVAKH